MQNLYWLDWGVKCGMVATPAVWIIIISQYVATNCTCSSAESRGEIPRVTKSWRATQGGWGVVPKLQLYQAVYKLNRYVWKVKGPKIMTYHDNCLLWMFFIMFVANLREELKNNNNQRWSGSTSLLDQSHHLSSSCVCPHAAVLPFPRRGMLMETSWLPDCILQGSRTPGPPFSQLKHTVKTQDWGSRHSRALGCCCVNWSCMLALLMENPHVRADCSSPDAWGAGGRRPRAILSLSHVCNCADHLSTPFVDFIKLHKHF